MLAHRFVAHAVLHGDARGENRHVGAAFAQIRS